MLCSVRVMSVLIRISYLILGAQQYPEITFLTSLLSLNLKKEE